MPRAQRSLPLILVALSLGGPVVFADDDDVRAELRKYKRSISRPALYLRVKAIQSLAATGDARALSLEGEWHRNRLTLVSIRDQSAPMRDHPLWDPLRLAIEGHALLEGGRLHVEGLVHPIVPFDECAEAYRQIDEDPASSIKLGIQHSSA